jgi:hypothetical protein
MQAGMQQAAMKRVADAERVAAMQHQMQFVQEQEKGREALNAAAAAREAEQRRLQAGELPRAEKLNFSQGGRDSVTTERCGSGSPARGGV